MNRGLLHMWNHKGENQGQDWLFYPGYYILWSVFTLTGLSITAESDYRQIPNNSSGGKPEVREIRVEENDFFFNNWFLIIYILEILCHVFCLDRDKYSQMIDYFFGDSPKKH